MEKTAYPAWKAKLWIVGSFFYTFIAISLASAFASWLASWFGMWLRNVERYAFGFLILLLAGYVWLASRHRGLAIPVLLVEVVTLGLLMILYFALRVT